jgi:hypothetical protein
MIKVGQQNLERQKGIPDIPDAPTATVPGVPIIDTTPSVAGKQVTLTWTDGIGGAPYSYMLHRSKDNIFALSPSNLIGVYGAATLSANDSPGIGTWYYIMVACGTDGQISDHSALATAVVT